MAFEVADLDATIAELKARGVAFEYDEIVEVEGNYPSKHSSGERAVWIRDSEDNLLGIGQPV